MLELWDVSFMLTTIRSSRFLSEDSVVRVRAGHGDFWGYATLCDGKPECLLSSMDFTWALMAVSSSKCRGLPLPFEPAQV